MPMFSKAEEKLFHAEHERDGGQHILARRARH